MLAGGQELADFIGGPLPEKSSRIARSDMAEPGVGWQRGLRHLGIERGHPVSIHQRPTVQIESDRRLDDFEWVITGRQQFSEAGTPGATRRVGVHNGDEQSPGACGMTDEDVSYSLIGRLRSEDPDSRVASAGRGEGVGDAFGDE